MQAVDIVTLGACTTLESQRAPRPGTCALDMISLCWLVQLLYSDDRNISPTPMKYLNNDICHNLSEQHPDDFPVPQSPESEA